MALISRLARLFKADFHAVLDNLEEPEILLKHSIREMEECNRSLERDLVQLSEAVDLTDKRIRELKDRLGTINSELDVCFNSGSDGLAKNHIRRKLETEKQKVHLNGQLLAKKEQQHALQEKVEGNRLKLMSLRQKAELFTNQAPAEPFDFSPDFLSSNLSVSADEIEIAFLSEKNQRRQS